MNVKIYTVLAALPLLAAAHSASAQFSIGPRLGLNLATVSYSGEGTEDANPKIKAGVQVGVAANIGFGEKFAFQPALLYSQKGFKQDETRTEEYAPGITVTATSKGTASFNYLEVPLNFVFTTGGEDGFQVFAGPYLAAGIGGEVEQSYSVKDNSGLINESGSDKANVKFADKEGSDNYAYVRGFDFGFNGGLGYRKGPFQVQAGYGLGLGNLIPNDEDGNEQPVKVRNGVIQVAATYFFSLK